MNFTIPETWDPTAMIVAVYVVVISLTITVLVCVLVRDSDVIYLIIAIWLGVAGITTIVCMATASDVWASNEERQLTKSLTEQGLQNVYVDVDVFTASREGKYVSGILADRGDGRWVAVIDQDLQLPTK